MSEYMDYNQFLEKELNIYKRENKLLNDKLDNFTTMFNEDENKQLKQHISHLASENTRLQNDLFTEQLNEDETNDYIDKLKNELFNTYLLNEHQERLISELKTALSSYNNFVDVMFPD